MFIDYIRTIFATQQDAYKMRVKNKTRISAWVFDAAAAAVKRYQSTGLRGAYFQRHFGVPNRSAGTYAAIDELSNGI